MTDVPLALRSLDLPTSFCGQFGLFVVADGAGGDSVCFRVAVENGRVVSYVVKTDQPDAKDRKDLDLSCTMRTAQWRELASADWIDAPRVLEELDPDFSGHLSYFVRHVEPLLRLLTTAAGCVVQLPR